MYDFSFSSNSLNREFIASDFIAIPDLVQPEIRSQILLAAEHSADFGFNGLSLETYNLRGRTLYQHMTLSQDLALRKLSRNIKVLTKVKQSDRDEIVKGLIALLREGEDYWVFKLDIKNFYPSVSRNYIDESLKADSRFPGASYSVWRSFAAGLQAKGINGLPPGLSLSATLSEYILRDFDRQITNSPGVYYYARYVDDMVILTTKAVDAAAFISRISSILPSGLHLNAQKSRSLPIQRKSNATPVPTDGAFDFLGYKFTISQKYRNDGRFVRNVSVDIASKKISKIKTKISLSAVAYLSDHDFDSFDSRFKIITGNYHVYDFDKNIRRNVGIYYNYRQVEYDKSVGLLELDHFLRKFLLSRTGRICGRLALAMSNAQRRRLLKYSFCSSFASKTHYHFNATDLTRLVRCWKYA